jgi:putative addiction module killer protein
MEGLEKQLRIYHLPDGSCPYLTWFQGLKDKQAKQKIQARLARLRLGNCGHTRSLGEGVHEMKIDFGPGYRIYFGQYGNQLVILLCGGDKHSQNKDIKSAKEYWKNYKKERINANQ